MSSILSEKKYRVLLFGLVLAIALSGSCFLCFLSSYWSDFAVAEAAVRKPVINSAILGDDKTIDVVWNKMSGVSSFEIYRSKSKNGTFSKIGSVKGNKTTFNDKKIEKYGTYWYKLKAASKGKKSKFSSTVFAYWGDESIQDENVSFIVTFPEGDEETFMSGDGMTTNTYNLRLTPEKNGKAFEDYDVHYDKGSLAITEAEDGSLNVKVLSPGMHYITFKYDSGKCTFNYNAEGQYSFDNDYFKYFCNGMNYETGMTNVFYPETIESVLAIRHNGKNVSDFKVKSSNSNIASVSKSGSKVIITSKSVGKCTVTITSEKNKGHMTVVVNKGNALTQRAAYGVPIGKNVKISEARKAVKAIIETEYSSEEMKKMATENMTLAEWQKKLSKPADVICMLRTLNFNDKNDESEKIDNDDVQYGGYRWCSKLSPEGNYKQRFLVCRSSVEMMNVLLRNDMEEQGYVDYSSPGGGHSFCYYKVGKLYVFVDFVDLIASKNLPYENSVVFVTDDPKELAEHYITEERKENPKSCDYIYVLYMYPMEGRTIPGTETDSVYHLPDCGVIDVLPETWNGQDCRTYINYLYTAPGFTLKYIPGPPESMFPEM